MVRRIKAIARDDRRDEINRHQICALMQQLEYRVLGVRPHPAPGDRRSRAINRAAVRLHALAVALHLQLLKVAWQEPQPLVIGEAGAGLAATQAGVIEIAERGAQRQVGKAIGFQKMPVHCRGTVQKFGKFIPAQRQCDRKADRRPQRIAPANAFVERQHPGFIDAPFDRLVGISGQRHDPSERIGHPALLQPVQRRAGVGHGFGGGEGLAGDCHHRGRGIAGAEGCFQSAAIDVGDDMDVNLGPIASQRIKRQRRTQRRSADADVDQVLDRPQQTGVDRLNQALGAQMQRRRLFNRGIAADPALGGMLNRAALGDVDRLARKHRAALLLEANRIGQGGKGCAVSDIKVRFGPIEPHRPARQIELGRPRIQPGRIGKQGLQRGLVQRAKRLPCCGYRFAHRIAPALGRKCLCPRAKPRPSA